MLLCVVNECHTIKRHFCEKPELKNESAKLSFFKWMVDDVVKPTNSLRNEKNDYVFVTHNESAYDTQFKSAHEFFGYRNVNISLHMNRMIELKIQIHTGYRLSSVFFKDSYRFINLPLGLLPSHLVFTMNCKRVSFHIY